MPSNLNLFLSDPNNAVDILMKLGGYDIAGMTGLFLGGAIYRIPIVIDGFISAAAAALAMKISPTAKEYFLCSHVSGEPAGNCHCFACQPEEGGSSLYV